MSESEADTAEVVAYEEKPEIPHLVSTGVYVLEPHVADYVPCVSISTCPMSSRR